MKVRRLVWMFVPGLIFLAACDRQTQSGNSNMPPSAENPAEAPEQGEALANASPPAQRLTEAPPGSLAVGEKAPDFVLTDQYGESQSLDEMLASHNVALVFYRSADW